MYLFVFPCIPLSVKSIWTRRISPPLISTDWSVPYMYLPTSATLSYDVITDTDLNSRHQAICVSLSIFFVRSLYKCQNTPHNVVCCGQNELLCARRPRRCAKKHCIIFYMGCYVMAADIMCHYQIRFCHLSVFCCITS